MAKYYVKWHVNNSPVAFFVANSEGKYEHVNDVACKLLGYSKEELLEMTTSDVVFKEDIPLAHKRFNSLKEMGKPVTEVTLKRKDGQPVYVILNATKLPDGKLMAFCENITERKKAEQPLLESEAKYRELVNLLPEMIFEIDTKANIIFANARALELTGYSEEDFKEGFNANCLVAPEDRERSKENMKQMFAGEMRQSNDYTFVRKDGTRFPVSLSSVPIIKDGKIIGARGVAVDITERKKAEEALRLKEERYRSLADSLPEIVFETDINGKVVFANKQSLEITGYTKKDLAKGLGVFSLIAPQDKEKANEHFIKTLNNQPSLDNEFTVVRKDGSTFPAIIVASLIAENERRVGLRGLVIDITERKKLEKQLQDQERLAAIGATAGMVGHDIRNPLQAITGDVYLAKLELASTPESEEKKNALESLDEIENNVTYINKIVADLQDYARPLKPETKETNLQKLIADSLTKTFIPKNIKVDVNVQDEMATVISDSNILRRVLVNLVTNSVQAMPKGGNLGIHAYREGEDNVITVKDTGAGIPEEAKSKLFTPLFTTKSKGQGLGLAVVKRLTESLGGTVAFESLEGKGSTFMIRLPSPKS